MKQLTFLVCLCSLVLTAQAALPQPDLIAKIHFAGSKKIFANANVTAFTNEFCSTEAVTLRAQTANRLSGWLAGWLQTNLNLNAAVAGGPVKLRPLFDDLQTSEWFLEARSGASGRPEVAIAIQLAPARAQLWQANLKAFFAVASFKTVNGAWLIFDSDPAVLNLGDRLAREIATPPAGWFDLDINWPLLGRWYPELKALSLPETQLGVTAPDNNFRINGKFFFPENLALDLDTWRLPTNSIHQPFDSFTAVRGFASWLKSQSWAQPYQLSAAPNELFTWALTSFPFQSFAAVTVPDALAALSQTYANVNPIVARANNADYFTTPVEVELTNHQMNVLGLPFISPKLWAVNDAAGQFLEWETFPSVSRPKPLPQELYQRLATRNLVFYHWEITAQRMPQMLQVSQFILLATRHKQLSPESASFKWLQRIGATLGNTDTEITQTAPAELTFERKAPGVFTAAELFTLANWFEAPNFPGCDLTLPPLSPHMKLLRQQRTQQGQQQTPQVISIPAPSGGH